MWFYLRVFTPVILICLLILPVSTAIAEEMEAEEASTEELKVTVGDSLEPFMLPIYGQRGKYIALRDFCGEPRPMRPNEPRRIVVISFFASWCKPCKKEIPQLERLASEWGEEVVVFLVAMGDKSDDIDTWCIENNTDLTILIDPYKATSVERYGINKIPTLFVLDKEGLIQYMHIGYTPGDEEEVDKVVRQMMGK